MDTIVILGIRDPQVTTTIQGEMIGPIKIVQSRQSRRREEENLFTSIERFKGEWEIDIKDMNMGIMSWVGKVAVSNWRFIVSYSVSDNIKLVMVILASPLLLLVMYMSKHASKLVDLIMVI